MRRRLWIEKYIQDSVSLMRRLDILNLPSRQQPVTITQLLGDALFKNGVVLPPTDMDCFIVLNEWSKAFALRQSHIYKIAERFGKHLAKTNLEVPTKNFPVKLGNTYLIEFPDEIEFRGAEGEYWHCVLVYVGAYDPNVERTHTTAFSENYPKMLNLLFPDQNEKGEYLNSNTIKSFPLIKATLQECAELKATDKSYNKPSSVPRDVMDFVIKCLLYIESGEPDLIDEEGYTPRTNKPKKRRRELDQLCPFDVKKVGYSFHERLYHMGSTSVIGHFRWQPYGAQRSQVKLVWINEHARVFNKIKALLRQRLPPNQTTQ